jgi:hypothetical protein
MAQQVSQDLAAAVTPSQVKLCPCNEEEPAIWFRLIEAQFATNGIKTQKLKYANALANRPKKVLWDILDIVDAFKDFNHPFDDLKAVLFGDLARASGNPILHCCVCP